MTDDDSTADGGSIAGTAVYTCDECGSFIDPTTWTPVEGVESDGEYEIHRFCDEACRTAWKSGA
jgi:tellurite resistance-related uncharacterized protein